MRIAKNVDIMLYAGEDVGDTVILRIFSARLIMSFLIIQFVVWRT